MKKGILLILSLILVLALAVGCAPAVTTPTTTGPGTTAPTTAPTTTVGPPVEVVYLFPSLVAAIPRDLDVVEAAINEIAIAEANVKVKMMTIANANYAQQATLMITARERLDLMLTMPGGPTHYSTMVANNQLTDITDLVPQHAQGIIDEFEAVNPEFMAGALIGGRLYGIPTLFDKVTNFYFAVRQDMLTKHNLNLAAVKNLTDLEALVKVLADNEDIPVLAASGTDGNVLIQGPLMINFENFADTIPFDNFGSSTWLYGAVIGEGSTTVVNPFATEYFAKYTQITHEWFNKGYIHRDAATQTETGFLLVRNNAALAHMNAGEFDIKASLDQRTGMDIAVLKVAEGIVNTGIMQKFTWAVPVTSRVPEAALKFLALTYTDAEVLNLINYGIEDVHYVVEADGRINWPQGVTSLTSPYFPGGNFLFGNAYLAKVRVGPVSPPDMRQQILEINQNVQTSPLLGFSVVTRTFVNELAAVANVYAQFGEGLMAGSSNPATVLPQFLAALEAAGYPRILAEVQKQVDAFKAANR